MTPTSSTQASLGAWSLVLRALCLVGAALLCATPLLIATDTVPISITTGGDTPVSLRIETAAQRWRALAVSLLPVLAGLYALARLWQLFGRYARGDVFSAATVRVFDHFARALLLYGFATVAARALMSVALTWDRPPGSRVLMLGVGSDDYVLLLFGVLLVAIGRVMHQAAKLAEDQAGFV